jgi:hypothetical protein
MYLVLVTMFKLLMLFLDFVHHVVLWGEHNLVNFPKWEGPET